MMATKIYGKFDLQKDYTSGMASAIAIIDVIIQLMISILITLNYRLL